MRRRQFLFASVAAALSACAGGPTAPSASRPPSLNAAHIARGIWPAFMSGVASEIREAYVFAAGHQQALEYIPCYCGCGGSGHTSNADCFVRSEEPGGWVVLDPHGAACGVCVGIALETKAMLGRTMPLRDIRATIDKKWSSAGPGTKTPLP
jgi:hypothetical protein